MVVIPVIDLARHVTPAQLAKSLKSALETVGFIYLSNYGFEHETTELFDVAREWFALESAEEKQRCRIVSSSSLRPVRAGTFWRSGDVDRALQVNNKGYDKLYGEVLDPIANPEGDLKESINLGVIEGTPAVPTQPIPQRLLQHVEFLARFQQKSFDLSQRLLEAFAIALNVRSSSLLDTADPVSARLELLHVTAPERPRHCLDSPPPALPRCFPRLLRLAQSRRGPFGLRLSHPAVRVEHGGQREWPSTSSLDGANCDGEVGRCSPRRGCGASQHRGRDGDLDGGQIQVVSASSSAARADPCGGDPRALLSRLLLARPGGSNSQERSPHERNFIEQVSPAPRAPLTDFRRL